MSSCLPTRSKTWNKPSSAGPLFYLHIPKAGGSSLLGVVESQFAASKMLVMYDVDFRAPEDISAIHSALPKKKQRQLGLIAGHFGFGAHDQVGAQPSYFTMLREPTARVISNYRHMRRNPRSKLRGLEHVSLDTFLDEKQWIDSDNGQVRRLSGFENEGRCVPFGECTLEMLEQAKANLTQHFPAFGIMEQFDLSLLIIQRNLGWRDVRYTRENNAPSHAAPLSQKTMEKLAQINALDIELYAFAKDLFLERVRQAGLDPSVTPSLQPLSFGFATKHKVRLRSRRLRRAALRRLGPRFRAH